MPKKALAFVGDWTNASEADDDDGILEAEAGSVLEPVVDVMEAVEDRLEVNEEVVGDRWKVE